MLSFDWNDRSRLDRLLREQGSDLRAIAAHAHRWVCDPAGFTTSPVCLLAPLAEALDEVGAGFAWLSAAVEDSWGEVCRDADHTLTSYAETDAATSSGLRRVAGRL
jgi:hypothetical protein